MNSYNTRNINNNNNDTNNYIIKPQPVIPIRRQLPLDIPSRSYREYINEEGYVMRLDENEAEAADETRYTVYETQNTVDETLPVDNTMIQRIPRAANLHVGRIPKHVQLRKNLFERSFLTPSPARISVSSSSHPSISAPVRSRSSRKRGRPIADKRKPGETDSQYDQRMRLNKYNRANYIRRKLNTGQYMR